MFFPNSFPASTRVTRALIGSNRHFVWATTPANAGTDEVTRQIEPTVLLDSKT